MFGTTQGTSLTADQARRPTIVTFNLKDFPSAVLDSYGIEARHPDDFVVDQSDFAPGSVVGAVLEQVRAPSRSPSPHGGLT